MVTKHGGFPRLLAVAALCVGSLGAADLPGAELVVSAAPGAPFRTIQAALDQAKAGDTVRVRVGVYRERVTFKTGGAKDHPLTLVGEAGAVIDGSDDVPLDWQPAPDIGPGVYRAAVGFFPFTVTVDGKIITTLDEKRTAPDAQEAPHNGWVPPKWPEAFRNGVGPSGWVGVKGLAMYRHVEGDLLIRLQDQADPHKAQITVAPRKPCVTIRGVDRCVLRGLTLRNAAYGVTVEKSSGTVIEQCEIGPVDYGVELGEGADHATVRCNDISYRPYAGADPSAPGQWDAWQACKEGGFYDRWAVRCFLSGGWNDIHDNYIHDEWDGVEATDISYKDKKPKNMGSAQINDHMLIHHNLFYNVFDDAIETQGTLAHTEYHDNIFRRCRCAFRIKAPTLGPIFSYRNVFLDNVEDYRNWNESSSVVSYDPGMLTAEVWLYQNTSTSRAAVNMNYTPEPKWMITAPNYHYVNNVFWCQYWVGKKESFPNPDWKGDGNVYVRASEEHPYPWLPPAGAGGASTPPPPKPADLLARWNAGVALAQLCKIDEHSLWVADRPPGFADAAHWNVALTADSVARARGIDLTTVRTADGSPLPGLSGTKRPDAGALQFGEAMPALPRPFAAAGNPPAGSWP